MHSRWFENSFQFTSGMPWIGGLSQFYASWKEKVAKLVATPSILPFERALLERKDVRQSGKHSVWGILRPKLLRKLDLHHIFSEYYTAGSILCCKCFGQMHFAFFIAKTDFQGIIKVIFHYCGWKYLPSLPLGSWHETLTCFVCVLLWFLNIRKCCGFKSQCHSHHHHYQEKQLLPSSPPLILLHMAEPVVLAAFF